MLSLLLLLLGSSRFASAAPAQNDDEPPHITQTLLVTITQTSTGTVTETLTSETFQSTNVPAYAPVQDDPRIPQHLADNVPRPENAESIFFLPPGFIPTPTLLNFTSSNSLTPPEPTLVDSIRGNSSNPESGPNQVNSGNSSTTGASFPSPLTDPLVAGYYPDWASGVLAPEDINFALLDWIDFAFAMPDAQAGITWDDPYSSPDLLGRLVAAAHSRKSKVALSIGGWGGSMCANASLSRRKMILISDCPPGSSRRQSQLTGLVKPLQPT
jgi:hypothetical protein